MKDFNIITSEVIANQKVYVEFMIENKEPDHRGRFNHEVIFEKKLCVSYGAEYIEKRIQQIRKDLLSTYSTYQTI